MKRLMIASLVMHGVAHLPGFAVAWRMMSTPELPYRTTILGGALDLGDSGARTLGLLWLGLAIGFLSVAIASGTGSVGHRLLRTTVALVVASTVMCVATWPEARIGVVANAWVLTLCLL